jgi:hypothetical protein
VFQSAPVAVTTRPSKISLAYIESDEEGLHYVFRIDGGVFETAEPGPLMELALHPSRLNRLGGAPGKSDTPLADASDPAALRRATQKIAASAYADTLYRLFGQPRAPIGLVGLRGQKAGRLGEYIAGADSLALDPGRITGQAQLRHALAHELAHRWQARARAQIATLWSGVAPIHDPKRYGYGDVVEHQAEAIAFAINFLQITAAGGEPAAASLALLDHYELLVPGSRTMVRYFSLQPVYQHHRLRTLLTSEPTAYTSRN